MNKYNPDQTIKINGRDVPRRDVVFNLMRSKVDDRYLFAIDGTIYTRDKSGSLRRVTPKK